MMREVFTTGVECDLGCQYCFASWGKYTPPLHIAKFSKSTASLVIPACDSEIQSFIYLLENNKFIFPNNTTGRIVITLSTKTILSEKTIMLLSDLNKLLKEQYNGFLKIGVSIPTISMAKELEPKAAPPLLRLKNLSLLKESGIIGYAIIKPILPFLPKNEFIDLSNILYNEGVKYVLIGQLYVDRNTPFFQKYIERKFEVKQRQVLWLPNKPVWDYVSDQDIEALLIQELENKSVKVFQSDIAFVNFLVNGN